MSSFWSWFVIIIVAINIIGCGILLFACRKNPNANNQQQNTTGHNFDGIEELNNPLPRWWVWLFWATIIFGVAYLIIYPGLGNFKGSADWSSSQQLHQETLIETEKYAPIYEKFYQTPIPTLAKNSDAMQIAERLFANNCAACHGADAKGAVGFPNLTNGNWLYGGSAKDIQTTILNGRNGMMPPMGAAIGGEPGIKAVTAYVRSLNGYKADPTLVAEGKTKFSQVCAACHGADAKGNPLLGAPNLTNNKWIFGGSSETIAETIRNGRQGKMPAQKQHLGVEKVHLLAAYVYGLSHGDN